jgi:hypothetical protein
MLEMPKIKERERNVKRKTKLTFRNIIVGRIRMNKWMISGKENEQDHP